MTARPTPDHEDFKRPRQHHLCPWWAGYLITNPIRRLAEDPESILAPFVEPGMRAVDIGCGMGFFSIPLARMVGETGSVICTDVQRRMLSSLERRASRRGLHRIIETRLISQEEPGLEDLSEDVDLVIAVHAIHESEFPERLFTQVRNALCSGGTLLVIEPNGHVSDLDLEATLRLALDLGLDHQGGDRFRKSRSLILTKPSRS